MPGQIVPAPTAPAGAGQPPAPAPTGLPFQPSPVGPQAVPTPERPTAAPAAPQAVQPELSPFEQYVSGQIPTSISFDIKQFGYDLFLQQVPAPPLVSQDVPVNPDYVVGPGDEIRVTVWGNIDAAWNVVVDRDGNISIPRLGVLGIAGLTFKEVKETIQKEMTKYYTEFQLNVSMGPLKTIRVYVVGNARFPGAYTISSLSTLINALVASGGPSKAGSMRDIQLKRGEQVVSHLDLYDLLMRGDKSKDQRVMSEDVIFIPSIGSLVGIAGNVERPAIYELEGRTKVSDVIKMAGGVTAEAYLQRVQVERVFQRKSKVILDLNLQSVKGKDDVLLEGGDIVKVFSIVSTVTNMITLQGNVRRPGEYEWKQGLRVRDIIPSFDALLPDAMLEYAIVERKVAPDLHLEYRSFDLGALLARGAEDQNIPLQPYDVVTVFNKTNVRQAEKVRISGAVNVPGEFEFRPNMKVSDLLKVAGGLKSYAFTEAAELTRTIPTQQGPSNERLSVNVSEALAGTPQFDVPLKENDYLLVKSVPDWELYKNVRVLGEVRFPGGYALKKGDVMSSLIERAGGYSKGAYLRGASFTRVSVKELQQLQITEMANRLERELLASSTTQVSTAMSSQEAEIIATQSKQKNAFLHSLKMVEAKGRMVIRLDEPAKMKNTPGDIMLEDGDVLIIPTNPQTVQVIGAVYNQSSFVYNPKKDVSYYIEQAGGFGETADEKRVYVLKCDGSAGKPKGGILWDPDSNRWASGSSAAIEAGDTIVVPDKLEEFAWMRNIKDITTIIYQVAVGAGVLLRF
jgi:protein involved in polysaccharide export with SLBB domain